LFSYNWSDTTWGLAYLALGLGFSSSTIMNSIIQDRIYRYLTRKHGEGRPEWRLVSTQMGMFFVPCGLLIWGWTAQNHTIAVGPLFGLFIYSFGQNTVFNTVLNYLVDAYYPYGAAAVATATFFRSVVGCVLPLFSEDVFTYLGYGRAATMLAGVMLVAVPVPALLFNFGPALRKRWAFKA